MWGQLCFILLWIPGGLFCQQWMVDSSRIMFNVKNAGIKIEGTFSGLQIKFDFNPDKLNSSCIRASVDASTVNTGIRIRDNHLRRSDYFNVKHYPHISLDAVNFQKLDERQYLGTFTVHLKGKQAQVSIPFNFIKDGNQVILQGGFEIERSKFDIGDRSLLLSDKVRVDIWVKARKE